MNISINSIINEYYYYVIFIYYLRTCFEHEYLVFYNLILIINMKYIIDLIFKLLYYKYT